MFTQRHRERPPQFLGPLSRPLAPSLVTCSANSSLHDSPKFQCLFLSPKKALRWDSPCCTSLEDASRLKGGGAGSWPLWFPEEPQPCSTCYAVPRNSCLVDFVLSQAGLRKEGKSDTHYIVTYPACPLSVAQLECPLIREMFSKYLKHKFTLSFMFPRLFENDYVRVHTLQR